MTGKPLFYFEDIYKSKGSYPYFESFPQRERLEQLFIQLIQIETEKLGKR